eukprot:5196551-Pyramimonas_sp.AAC.1
MPAINQSREGRQGISPLVTNRVRGGEEYTFFFHVVGDCISNAPRERFEEALISTHSPCQPTLAGWMISSSG